MKKILFILAITLSLGYASCQKADFAESYPNPAKISQTTVEKSYAGFVSANRWYVLPDYWNYFVVLRTTVTRYTQAVGWVNSAGQYVPGYAGIDSRWSNYYNFLAQFRDLEKNYNALSKADQDDRKIYMITSKIYLYDHTQKVVDLHGDIPFSEAGKLSDNGGDYDKSLPKYDGAEAIYTKMLDDLKAFSDELNTLTVSSGILAGFKTQDIVNKGDITMWKKYNNSLRLRILNRVSGVAAFSSRASSEIAAIVGDPAKYPIITENADNVQLKVTNINTEIHSKNFRTGLEDWNGNLAGKAMIDHMKTASDPRLRVMFEPGVNASGAYIGLDPMLSSSAQDALVAGGTISIYNRSTLSRNQFFPGVLINAPEVHFLLAEAHLRGGNATAARTAYNNAVTKSIQFYYGLRALTNDNTSPALTPTNDTEIAAYLAHATVDWDAATTPAAKLKLIAAQKWIHYSVVQPLESWSEIRRLDAPTFSFEIDNTNTQKTPPARWLYSGTESVYNTVNYNTMKAKDNLTTRLFWDAN
ncbi:SusD/RagB family nutrient-binding outer membrane lipoprotein [Daejeonella sp.]|uniref:SusD/RagB family nutrient-binding outer membrane lipoprotein n=1 Tax=Daejeonella sp. TaxID=2805397 RepID=UPI0025BF9697|nr:SusD/RagB family nutrient-binding outer membrane lipoprotein [Daejeonella sp.]